jgi:hypothetical protein
VKSNVTLYRLQVIRVAGMDAVDVRTMIAVKGSLGGGKIIFSRVPVAC